MNDELSQDRALIRDFLVESEELLQHMDQDMVALESAPSDTELLNRIFRALHTIKGTSGFLGFDPMVRLSHAAEDLLSALCRGDLQLDRRAMDSLLAARDQLGAMLQDIRGGGLQTYSLEALLAELHDAQRPRTVPPLGQMLVQQKVISANALGELLAEQAASPTPRKLGELIVEKGLSTPSEIGQALAQQKKLLETPPSSTMRVDARKLDELVNLIGELVLERNRLVQLSRDCSAAKVSPADLDASLGQSTARLSFITEELQSAGLKTRMVPIETVFRRFPRLVRDVARTLQKEVQLILRGEDTELDKTMVELIGDPLVHLVRNALDHGIESPALRQQSGKPPQGTIRLEARQEGDQIVISIADDGAGIDIKAVGRKALEKRLVTAERLRALQPREILDFIFLPGFSTAEKATDLSGRGVGMDVVRSNLNKLNGSVDLDTRPGHGTTFLLRLPLTLAILPVLLVRVGEEIYALPLHSVAETAQVDPRHVHSLEGREVLCLRDETLSLIRLSRLFDRTPQPLSPTPPEVHGTAQARKVVILAVGEKRIALLVDHLLGQESTVVKPLGDSLHRCSGLAGATISGDGRVRLVLDPPGLLAASQFASSLYRKATA
ncbi:MAG TPA: chemotaxis protein CheA [Verrucomicrobiae bacterium]|nr:chemotaxis protein CheA [Verrucomicrobiae bacterium]